MSEDERNMFPFFPFKKGKWIEVTDTITGGTHTTDLFYEYGDESILVLSERVKFMLIMRDEFIGENSITYYPSSRFFDNEIKFVIRFLNPVTPNNEGQRITMMCYVEDE